MVFVDTPGLVDPRYLLHRAMMHIALDVIGDSDVVLLLIDASAGVPEFGEDVMELLDRAPRLLVVSNKVDVAAAAQRERVREWSRERLHVEPRRGLRGDGGGDGDAARRDRTPPSRVGVPLPGGGRLVAAGEVLRGRADPRVGVRAVLAGGAVQRRHQGGGVPRERLAAVHPRGGVRGTRSQKAIVVGSGGQAIKKLGQVSREKIEEFVGRAVYLDLWVKVLPRWRKDPVTLQRLGFKLPDAEQRS
jgi:GTP-binding protein Era